IEVNIFDKNNNLCLYANLTVDFSVAYKGTDNKTQTANFELPANATTKGSLCEKSSLLKLNFENGHSWSMNLTTDEKSYQANTITFSYNLNDTKLFPNASSQGNFYTSSMRTVTVNPDIKDVGIGTSYSCMSKDTIQSDTVNQTLWNVLIQAFVENNSTSKNGEFTSCIADLSTTTVAPTTHGTNSTTAAPVTNTTSIAPPTTTADTGAGCLLANFGLRIGLWRADEMNLEPNKTTASGSCKANSSELVLVSDSMTITLTFTNDTKKFHLSALNATGNTSFANTSLSLWEASLGSSYLCNKEQNYTITGLLTLFTFDLHVQPFGVNKNVFSTAHECSMDDINILIPIIVGAALAGLIVIVVIAYVIGRRKTHVGYQTL
uniref:Uncharacterized protein n=1 Tax=Mola mola TaxID=94237 RepID=A0A3Q4ALY5_MOLML